MGWLFWFLLVTLSTLLGRVDASSVTKASTAQINVSTLVNHEATIHALPVEHNPNIKRNLRGTVMKTTTVYLSPQKHVNGEEERALPVGNMLDRVKKTMSQPLRNGIDKAKNYLFKDSYKAGDTPESLKAAYYGTKTREEASNTRATKALTDFVEKWIGDYKVWLDQVHKTGPK